MLGDKLSPGTKPGFLKSEKMLGFELLYIHKSVLENVYFSNTLLWIYKSSNPNIFSDLRKPGLVPGKSLSPSIKIDPVEENYLT